MKRQTLIARAEYLHQKQESLARAAKEFAKYDSEPGNSSMREQTRRNLHDAGIAYGLACKRYLGGRE